MSKFNLRKFFGWKLLIILAMFAVIFQLILMLMDWHYMQKPLELNAGAIQGFVTNYVNILFVGVVSYSLVRWLNKVIPWTTKNALLRVSLDFVIFTVITLGWITLVNVVVAYFKDSLSLDMHQLIYLMAVGLIVNLFLIPIIELMALMNQHYESELNVKQLMHENTRFRYEILKNQVNPHFLFNSLSVLSSLISSTPDVARKYINSFSGVLRHALAFKDHDTIELEEEKKFLEEYVYLLKVRFGDAFDAELDFPSGFLQMKILPMVLQLLVENVVKHNKMTEANPMLVNITCTKDGIIVANRVDFKTSGSNWGISLKNIQQRYESLGLKINIENNQGIFKVVIPYIK